MRQLSADDIDRGVAKVRRRIDDIQKLKTDGVRWDAGRKRAVETEVHRDRAIGPRGILTTMPQPLSMPPPGFDELLVEDKIDYVQNLWDRIAANQDQIPLQEWHRQILEERLAAHRAAPDIAKPWGEVLDGHERRLKTR